MRYDSIEKRDKLVAEKILRSNDLGDLRIYTYVNWCKKWTEDTLNSRGIILNRKTGEVVAQPFPKFFNMNQRRDTQERNLPWKDGFRIFKKHDGWLGILYRNNEQHRIATRGSFDSVGALWATEYLKRFDLTGLPDDVTLLFELICPATHIVVDYHGKEDLILLAAYNRRTGDEYPWEQIEKWSKEFGITLVESYDQKWFGYCRGQIKTIPGNELEGFVVRFNNGLRIKIKSDDYLRRSDLLANLTPLVIWDNMINGKVPKDVWNEIDACYYDKLNKVSGMLERRYKEVNLEIQQQIGQVSDYFDQVKRDYLKDRKKFAEIACKMSHRAALFILFDALMIYGGSPEGPMDDYIMKQIRPKNNVIGN